jgi:D-glycerate 3-kinase
VITSEKSLFIHTHSLSKDYLQQASKWFDPMVETLTKHQTSAGKPLIVGINGCQGSGKTTFADYLSLSFKARGLSSIAISIDDFYLTQQQRQHLATEAHPLLMTRGVPGTHDLALALKTLNALKEGLGDIAIPRFNKAQDDRFPQKDWSNIKAPVDIILLEGWCVGVAAQAEKELIHAINPLEALEDSDGRWRQYVNQELATSYKKLWELLDRMIMLQAPSFDCVYKWRLEQEQKLSHNHLHSHYAKSNKIMAPDQIKHFIQHYERLTRHCLNDLPKHCDHVFELTRERQILSHYSQTPLSNYHDNNRHNNENSSDVL